MKSLISPWVTPSKHRGVPGVHTLHEIRRKFLALAREIQVHHAPVCSRAASGDHALSHQLVCDPAICAARLSEAALPGPVPVVVPVNMHILSKCELHRRHPRTARPLPLSPW